MVSLSKSGHRLYVRTVGRQNGLLKKVSAIVSANGKLPIKLPLQVPA
jgi:hypothetical protein